MSNTPKPVSQLFEIVTDTTKVPFPTAYEFINGQWVPFHGHEFKANGIYCEPNPELRQILRPCYQQDF